MIALMVAAALIADNTASNLAPLTGADVRVRVRNKSVDTPYYPERAMRLEKEGRASALCLIADNGDLQDCQVVTEEPEGWQFGEAVARLASKMRADKTAKDGSPTAGRRFLFQLNFKLPR